MRREEPTMRRFQLYRIDDPTGVSGTGIVAEGVHFRNNKVALTWLRGATSISIWDSMRDMVQVHGHDGATRVRWIDDWPYTYE